MVEFKLMRRQTKLSNRTDEGIIVTRLRKAQPAVVRFCCLSLLLIFAGATTAQRSVQKTPLEWASVLVRELQPEDTSYQHHQDFVKWKGENGAEGYESRTDCSGFLNALLERAYGLTPDNFERLFGKRRPLAVEYFEAIQQQKNFRRITSEQDVRPGDVIAIRYPPGTNDNTGHILLIAGLPVRHKASKPEIEGTEQWEISVIDSSESGHGKTDTRHRPDATFGQGVGQGILRLYTRPGGEIIGYTWSIFAVSDYYDQTTRQLVIGRFNLPHGLN
jgi:hypothetical protein